MIKHFSVQMETNSLANSYKDKCYVEQRSVIYHSNGKDPKYESNKRQKKSLQPKLSNTFLTLDNLIMINSDVQFRGEGSVA